MPKRHQAVTDELRDTAALYSAGVLEPDLAVEFEQHLQSGCEACASEVRAFEETAAQLAFSLPTEKPPAGLRDRLMGRIAAKMDFSRVLVRSHEGAWVATGFPGVEMRRLFVDRTTGNVTSLLKVSPGAIYPAHRHFGHEQCYVLDGDVIFQDHVLESGDYEVSMASTEHSTVTTTHGCLLLMIQNRRDELLA